MHLNLASKLSLKQDLCSLRQSIGTQRLAAREAGPADQSIAAAPPPISGNFKTRVHQDVDEQIVLRPQHEMKMRPG